MGYRNWICDTGSVPYYLVEPFLKHLQIDTFIETGTAAGESIRWAAKHFKECHTIELIEDRAQVDETLENVKWHTGNTIDVLPTLVSDLVDKKPEVGFNYAMFFLDAHYSGDTPNPLPQKECYILEELDIISKYDQDSIVIIDDLRLFCGNPPQPNNAKDWASIQEIFALFNSKFKWHFTTICDDFIISMPDRIKWVFDEHWMGAFDKRYPTEEAKLKMQTKNVWNAFQQYLKP